MYIPIMRTGHRPDDDKWHGDENFQYWNNNKLEAIYRRVENNTAVIKAWRRTGRVVWSLTCSFHRSRH